MADVVFYILPSLSQRDRHLFTCRLIEKVYKNRQFCYVYTHSHQQSLQLDKQLWTFRAGSFIPHQILENHLPECEQSILIGTQDAPDTWQKIIVNLSTKCPKNTPKMERILEILDASEAIKQAGRVRYRQYQQDGYNITTHTM